MANSGFWGELKRRHVYRVVVAYAVVGWLLIEIATQVFPFFKVPDWSVRLLVLLIVIGFPIALILAWAFEMTPDGVRRTEPADSPEARAPEHAHRVGKLLNAVIIGVLALAVAALLWQKFAPASRHVGTVPAMTAAAPGDASDATVKGATDAAPGKSIAVLPFENLSNDKSNDYFVAGMQDLILTKLADIGDLKVISRTSTMQYGSHPQNLKTIGQQLGVVTLLEGSVQKAGNQVLVNVQLIDARTDNHIWAQSYTRTLDNVFGVEGEVAEQIATALKAKLSPAESKRLATSLSPNNAANDLFLRAEYQGNQGLVNYDTASWKASIPLYRQAIQQDPNFALAYARLSYQESELAWFGGGGMDVEQLNQQARSDAENALRLAPGLAAAQLAVGYSDYYGRGDYAAALKAFAAALALRPNDADTLAAQGYVERRQGRFDVAIASLQQAFALDPRNSALAFELGSTYVMAGSYTNGEDWYQRALALDPRNLNAKSNLSQAIVYATGDIPRALAAAQGDDPVLKQQRVALLAYQRKYGEALALLDSVPDTADNFGASGGPKALAQAELYRLAGDMSHARPLYAQALPKIRAQLAMIQGINQAGVWQNLAIAELGLGQTEQGLDAVAKAQAIVAQSDDHSYGPIDMETNATLYAEAKRPNLAVPLLAKALAAPGIGRAYSPVLLWLDPAWDPIRHDPGFQALLNKYASHQPAAIPATGSTAALPLK